MTQSYVPLNFFTRFSRPSLTFLLILFHVPRDSFSRPSPFCSRSSRFCFIFLITQSYVPLYSVHVPHDSVSRAWMFEKMKLKMIASATPTLTPISITNWETSIEDEKDDKLSNVEFYKVTFGHHGCLVSPKYFSAMLPGNRRVIKSEIATVNLIIPLIYMNDMSKN